MTSITTTETTSLNNGNELLDWPEEDVKQPLPKQFGAVEEPIQSRFRLNTCRNFVTALCCVLIVYAFVFYFGFFTQVGPCNMIIDKTSNIYRGKTLVQLKSLVIAANVTSQTIKQLVRRLFDKNMDCLFALESAQEGKDVFVVGEISGEGLPGPEPNIITYYKDRLSTCETPQACSNNTIQHLVQQLDIELKTHPLSPENIERVPITDVFCTQKKKEIEGILKRIVLLVPAHSCTVNQVYEWEKLTYALLATRDRIEYFIGLANVAEDSSSKPYKRHISDSSNPYQKPRSHLN